MRNQEPLHRVRVQAWLTAPADVTAWHRLRVLLAGGTPSQPIYPTDAELARRVLSAGMKAIEAEANRGTD